MRKPHWETITLIQPDGWVLLASGEMVRTIAFAEIAVGDSVLVYDGRILRFDHEPKGVPEEGAAGEPVSKTFIRLSNFHTDSDIAYSLTIGADFEITLVQNYNPLPITRVGEVIGNDVNVSPDYSSSYTSNPERAVDLMRPGSYYVYLTFYGRRTQRLPDDRGGGVMYADMDYAIMGYLFSGFFVGYYPVGYRIFYYPEWPGPKLLWGHQAEHMCAEGYWAPVDERMESFIYQQPQPSGAQYWTLGWCTDDTEFNGKYIMPQAAGRKPYGIVNGRMLYDFFCLTTGNEMLDSGDSNYDNRVGGFGAFGWSSWYTSKRRIFFAYREGLSYDHKFIFDGIVENRTYSYHNTVTNDSSQNESMGGNILNYGTSSTHDEVSTITGDAGTTTVIAVLGFKKVLFVEYNPSEHEARTHSEGVSLGYHDYNTGNYGLDENGSSYTTDFYPITWQLCLGMGGIDKIVIDEYTDYNGTQNTNSSNSKQVSYVYGESEQTTIISANHSEYVNIISTPYKVKGFDTIGDIYFIVFERAKYKYTTMSDWGNYSVSNNTPTFGVPDGLSNELLIESEYFLATNVSGELVVSKFGPDGYVKRNFFQGPYAGYYAGKYPDAPQKQTVKEATFDGTYMSGFSCQALGKYFVYTYIESTYDPEEYLSYWTGDWSTSNPSPPLYDRPVKRILGVINVSDGNLPIGHTKEFVLDDFTTGDWPTQMLTEFPWSADYSIDAFDWRDLMVVTFTP